MIIRPFKIIFFAFACLLSFAAKDPAAQKDKNERHISVSMRMIGHEFLLSLCDSVSRVLPIEKDGDRYKIQFESDFQFDPDDLVSAVDRVMTKTRIARSGYLVEVEECVTNKVYYSYEVGNWNWVNPGMIPCGGRMLPQACYSIFISIVDAGEPATSLNVAIAEPPYDLPTETKQANYFPPALWAIPLLFLVGSFIYFGKKKRSSSTIDPNMIAIGKSQFDKKNMELSFEDKKTELTHKEADLLFLLHSSVNMPLEREVILNAVWGDEGDYVGRTVDVFISKLRKKLEADSSVKIVNIRGIGYKLVVN